MREIIPPMHELHSVKRTVLLFALLILFALLPVQASAGEAAPAHSKAGISLMGERCLEWPCGIPYEEPGYSAFGPDGEDMSDRVEVKGNVCCWKAGTYNLSYSFVDDGGNRYVSRRIVKVVPAELPETVQAENTIYLSFDDGPCEYTMKVLDLLDKYDAKATFFVIAREGRQYLDLISEIYNRGHSIGVHCSYHEYGVLYSSEEHFFEDFMLAQQIIYEKTGSYAHISRFPGGSDTAANLMDRKIEGGFDALTQRLADMGIRYYDWNVKIEGEGRSGDDLVWAFRRGVKKHDVPICLQHDTRIYSVNTLEQLLIWGTEEGYRFAAIDVSTPEIHNR